jgi:hypothetical protein
VEDLLQEQGHEVNLQPLSERGFTVLSHRLAIYGLCQLCGQAPGRKSPATRTPGSRMLEAGATELRERGKDIGYES